MGNYHLLLVTLLGNVNQYNTSDIFDKSLEKLTTDISFFEKIVLDLDLFHTWPTLSKCRTDLWDKGYYYKDDSNRVWRRKCGISDWEFGEYGWDFDDFVRLMTNIFVCIVFICLINRVADFFAEDKKTITKDKEAE